MSNKLSLLFILLLLVSCSLSHRKADKLTYDLTFEQLRDSALLPGWFLNPSPGGCVGSVGMARTISVGGNPEYHARKYAVDGLLDYYGVKINSCDEKYKNLLEGKKNSAVFQGRSFQISNTLKTSDYIIARAVSGGSSSCSESAGGEDFSPYDCSPGWICSPGSGGIGGVLGVSYRAMSPQRQYEIAIENGLLLLKYSYGVDVYGTEEIRRIKSGTGLLRIRQNALSVKMLDNKDSIKLYVKAIRYVGETIYLWLVSPDLPVFPEDNSWIYGNLKSGAVGESGKTASNLLSYQIYNAFDKAVMNMAKNKELGIEVTELLRRTSGSSLFDQLIKSSVNTRVFPSLRGFYLDRNDRVMVWLVPNRL
ncbi:MAG: hypothetical protein H6681_03270 [Desulfobacteraceae bacterium]|nr:hypothetical protein [Desulfobacteraceae bacterium]